MMKGKLLRILRIVTLSVIVGLVGTLFSFLTLNKLQGGIPFSLYSNFNDYVAPDYGAEQTKAIQRSRDSAVRIVSGAPTLWGGMAYSSGTYFRANSRHYIITVLHGLVGNCETTYASYEEEFYPCIEMIIEDVDNDYAIWEVEPILSRTPIRIPQDLPTSPQWKNSYSLLKRLIYTGYPNTLGPLTLRGDVIGFSGTDYMYVFSYAWAGSSGSGVFDENGHYVGYIIAIDVGQTEFGVDVLENVVLVVPSFNVNWSSILQELP